MSIIGEAKEIDLEALRAALRAMDDEIASLPLMAKMRLTSDASVAIRRLTEARETVELALAELTTRRARDAEVEALVEAAQGFFFAQCNLDNREAMGPNADDHDTLMRRRNAARRELDDALVSFTGAHP